MSEPSDGRKLAGKVAIVTGASRGIGAAIARRLAADGAAVIVNYQRSATAAEQIVAEIIALQSKSVAVQADMADRAQVRRMFDMAFDQYRRLDILVNNAGVSEFCPLDEITEEHYAHLFDVNVRGVLFAMQEAVRRFGAAGGRILNISSGAAQACPPETSVYSASKAAVEALTKCYASELGARNITVNAVAPGFTETDMLAAVMPADARESMIARTPLGRIGTPEDIADVVTFLASEEARWITGQIIGVNGGLR